MEAPASLRDELENTASLLHAEYFAYSNVCLHLKQFIFIPNSLIVWFFAKLCCTMLHATLEILQFHLFVLAALE